jgi:hypothetical protein
MIRQAWLTLPSCLPNSKRPTLARMIFCSCAIVVSALTHSNARLEPTPIAMTYIRFDLNFPTGSFVCEEIMSLSTRHGQGSARGISASQQRLERS